MCLWLYCEHNYLIKHACPFHSFNLGTPYRKGTFFLHLVVILYYNLSTFWIGVCLYSVYGKTFGLVVEKGLVRFYSCVLEMSLFFAILYIFDIENHRILTLSAKGIGGNISQTGKVNSECVRHFMMCAYCDRWPYSHLWRLGKIELSLLRWCFFCRRHYNVRFDLPSGIRILYSWKILPLNDEVKKKFTLMFKKPQSKHKMSIKTSLLNSLYPSSI